MDNIIQFITERFGPKFLVGLFITSAVATSGVTGAKIVAGMKESPSSRNIPEVRVVQTAADLEQGDGNGETIPVNTPAGRPKTGTSTRPLVFAGVSPTSFPLAPTPIPTVKQSVNNANACIVTLFGVQYDVAPLRKTHSGGDIFSCNSDMTSVYQNRHGTNVSRMQAYLVGSGSSSGSGAGSTGATGTGSSFSNSDSEDEEHVSEEEREEYEHDRQQSPEKSEEEHKEDD